MTASDQTDSEEFMRGIDDDISDPARWPGLSEDRLCQVIGHAILAYGQFTAEELVPFISRMYPYVAENVSAKRRYQLLQNVTHRFSNEQLVPDDETRHRVDALLPFIAHDPDPRIVSTATLDFALLRASTTHPWLGVSQAFSMFKSPNVTNPPAILQGLIVLGDRRLSPDILELLTTSEMKIVQEVSKFQTQWVFAATVDLCCDWLEAVANGPPDRDPGGSVFGHVAAAIYRLGTRSKESGVSDISRVFPPPGPDEAVVLHGRWTQAEYAPIIGPRLMKLAEEESAPRILPDVLNEWGVTANR
jgi:hypothetical protein